MYIYTCILFPFFLNRLRMDTNGIVGAMIIDSDGLCLACK